MCNLCYQSRLLKQRKYVPNFKHWSNVICSAPKVMTRLGRATQMDVGFTNFGLGDDWRHLYTFWVMIPEFYFCHFLCSLQQDIIVITFFFKSPVILPQLFLDETNLKISFANVILAHTLPVWLMRIQKAIICKKKWDLSSESENSVKEIMYGRSASIFQMLAHCVKYCAKNHKSLDCILTLLLCCSTDRWLVTLMNNQ